MTRHNNLLLTAIIFLLSACSQMTMPEVEEPNFHHLTDPDVTPEGIGTWQTYVMTFSEDTCSSIKYYPELQSLSNIDAEAGDIISIIAMEGNGNTGFTDIKAGSGSGSYMVISDDRTARISQMWTSVFKVDENQTDFRQMLKPVTSEIRMYVENAPESFIEASVRIDSLYNAWTPCSNSFTVREKTEPLDIITEGEEVMAYILPPVMETERSVLDFTITLGDETYRPQIEVDRQALTRTSVSICIDFADYEKKGTFDIAYTYRSIMNGLSDKEVRTTVATSLTNNKPDNRHYTVQIYEQEHWTEQKVYDALCSNADKHPQIWNDWGNKKALRDTMSYCLIDTGFPAKVRVRKNSSTFSKAEIRPSIYGIEATYCGNDIIEFTIPSADKGKISVEFDGDRQHNLFIYAREPDTSKPTGNSSTVRYFGKGEHHPGTIRLQAGQTLYIDHGAKVYGKVKTEGSNITIAGHGILSGEKLEHLGDNQYSWGDFLISHNESKAYVKNLVIKDITMIDSPGWNLIIPQTDGVTLDGINMISWELNGDGIDIVSSRDVEIRNCFIRTYDDCITLKCRFIVSPITDVSNVRIKDCIIWADYARGIVVGPEAGNRKYSGRIHDIRINDCIFLQHKRGYDDDLRAAFAIGQGSDGSTGLWSGTTPPNVISDVHVSGMYFDNIDKKGRHTAIWQYGNTPVYMENINLTDFTIIDRNGNNFPALTIKTNGSTINGLKINNFTVNGTRMTSSSSMLSIDRPQNVNLSIQ